MSKEQPTLHPDYPGKKSVAGLTDGTGCVADHTHTAVRPPLTVMAEQLNELSKVVAVLADRVVKLENEMDILRE